MGQESFGDFLEDVSLLRIREWSTTAPLPAFLSEKLTRDQKVDFAVDLALLPRLYGEDYDNIAYSLMEAYLWSNAGKNSLREIGWLEGNIVIVDFSKQDRQILVPQADSPGDTLCTPYLWRLESDNREDPFKLLNGRFSSEVSLLRSRVEQSPNLGSKGRMLPQLQGSLRADLPDLLCNLFLDPGDRRFFESSEIAQRVLDPTYGNARQFVSRLNLGSDPEEVELERSLTQSLKDRLLHILVAEQVAELRTSRQEDQEGDEFVAYFHHHNEALMVDDAEISLACLDYCIGEQTPTIAGRPIKAFSDANELYHALGIATNNVLTPRGHNLRNWLRRFTELDKCDPQVLKTARINWEPTSLGKSDIVAAVRAILMDSGKDPYAGLRQIVKVLFSKSTRSRAQIESQHRIRLGIHHFLRYTEPFTRHLLAFPLTLTGERTEKNRKMTAYFLGTISDPKDSSITRTQQIVCLKRFVEQAFTNASLHHYMSQTLTKSLDEAMARRTIYEASFVFGHETKNRADAIQPGVHKRTIRQMLKNDRFTDADKESLAQMAESFSLVEELYGISELVSQLTKLSDGKLPIKWVQPQYRNKLANWNEHFKLHQDEMLKQWVDSCRDFIRYSLGPYVNIAKRDGYTLLLREIVDGVIVPTTVMDMLDEPPAICLPPFHLFKENRAAVMALLAGVGEHLRNAARHIIDSNKVDLILRVVGKLHIDFAIRVDVATPLLAIEIWNPCVDGPVHSETIKIMADLYRVMGSKTGLAQGLERDDSTNAIEIRKCERRPYPLAGENADDYVVSEVVIRPSRFSFS